MSALQQPALSAHRTLYSDIGEEHWELRTQQTDVRTWVSLSLVDFPSCWGEVRAHQELKSRHSSAVRNRQALYFIRDPEIPFSFQSIACSVAPQHWTSIGVSYKRSASHSIYPTFVHPWVS